MNEDKFSGKAEYYAKYRPSYPDELINWLYERTGADTAADIGAGTGIFTECLLKKPWRVIAVEPNPDMLKQLQRQAADRAKIISAPAENTSLPDNSVDLVTVAQAFHWFDEKQFKAECKRILTNKGSLAVIYNRREENQFEVQRRQIYKKYCPDFHTHMPYQQFRQHLENEYFASAEHIRYENGRKFSKEEFIGSVLSASYSPKKDDEAFAAFKAEICELFEKFSADGFIEIPYAAECCLGKF